MSDTYVIFTASGSEQKVVQEIQQQVLLPNEEIFCPTRILVKRIHGADRRVESSLYPGYIFLRTKDPENFFYRGREKLGVSLFQYMHMLRNDELLLPISDEEERLLYRLWGCGHCCEFSYGFIKGDKVIVTSGPLMGLEGAIKKVDRHRKTAKVRTELLGRELDITLGLEIVRRI